MSILPTNVQELKSNFWYRGWALDIHTTSSIKKPDDRFETTRPPLGEALYLLKYRDDKKQIEPIAHTVSNFVLAPTNHWWFHYISAIIPVPPSKTHRPFQPVFELAEQIARLSHIECHLDYLIKNKDTDQSKNLPAEQKHQELINAFSVADNRFSNKTVLVFDDLYDTGATMNIVCDLLKKSGNASYIYILTVTKTRKAG